MCSRGYYSPTQTDEAPEKLRKTEYLGDIARLYREAVKQEQANFAIVTDKFVRSTIPHRSRLGSR